MKSCQPIDGSSKTFRHGNGIRNKSGAWPPPRSGVEAGVGHYESKCNGHRSLPGLSDRSPSRFTYSLYPPECVEGRFSVVELLLYGVLRSTHSPGPTLVSA